MCLAVYLAAAHPLETMTGLDLRVEQLKRQRWPGDLFAQEHVYAVLAGCACALLSDGNTSNEERERQALLDELEAYLKLAARQGPVEALVCWGGDERKQAQSISMPPEGIGALDFDRAWDVPMRLLITNRER